MKNKIKIAFILPAINNNAPIKIALALANSAKKDFNITVYYLNDNKSDKNKILAITNNIRIIKFRLSLINEISQHDIIHSHCLLPDIINALFLKNKNKISTIHCDINKDLISSYGLIIGSLLSFVWRLILKKINKHVYLNHFVLEKYQLNDINSRVIHNGIDLIDEDSNLELIDKINGFACGRKILGSIGVLREIKGFTTILNAALTDQNDNCYIIAGSGPDRESYEKFVLDNNLENKVLLLGNVPNAYTILKEFDTIILASKSEGFPLVAIESLWSGKNIICTDIPAYKEVFKDAEVAFFPPGDHISLQKLASCSVKNFINLNNINIYRNKMTGNAMYIKYKEIYDEKK